MCQLLGLSFNQPINPFISFRGFRHRGKTNPCGWGIAFYPDRSACIIKEPLESGKSKLSQFLMDYPLVKSDIIISHVRKSTSGSVAYMNTHPFYRELNGKDYVFAHNGTLKDFNRLKSERFKPVGTTDSEHAFCYLLDSIDGIGENNNFSEVFQILSKINALGKFNCIFSDGEYMYCYFDNKGRGGLSYVHRQTPFSHVRLVDEDYEIELESVKGPYQEGYVIATFPLTNEDWVSFDPGELIVFKKGRMEFSSAGRHRKI